MIVVYRPRGMNLLGSFSTHNQQQLNLDLCGLGIGWRSVPWPQVNTGSLGATTHLTGGPCHIRHRADGGRDPGWAVK